MTAFGQDFTMHKGENCRPIIAVVDGAGAPKPLTGGSATWTMALGPEKVTKNAAIADNVATVELVPTDTINLPAGKYSHQLWVTDADQDIVCVAAGIVTLLPKLS